MSSVQTTTTGGGQRLVNQSIRRTTYMFVCLLVTCHFVINQRKIFKLRATLAGQKLSTLEGTGRDSSLIGQFYMIFSVSRRVALKTRRSSGQPASFGSYFWGLLSSFFNNNQSNFYSFSAIITVSHTVYPTGDVA